MVDYCEDCKKGYTDPRKLGTRLYCPHCGVYLGTTTKPEKPNLPPTWWRTKSGKVKSLERIQDERPKYHGKSKK
jgi:hypothetical protein